MNIVDWIIIAILAFFSVRSLFRGAVREVCSLLAVVLAGVMAVRYGPVAAPLFSPYINPAWAQTAAAYVLIFLLVYGGVLLAGILISKIIKTIKLSTLDKTAGALVGAAKAYFLICCIIILVLLFPKGTDLFKNSVLTPYCLPCITLLARFLPDPLQAALDEKTGSLEKKTLPSHPGDNNDK